MNINYVWPPPSGNSWNELKASRDEGHPENSIEQRTWTKIPFKTVNSYSDNQKTMEQNEDSNLHRVDDFTKQV